METSFLLECLGYRLRYWDIGIAYLLKDSDLCPRVKSFYEK